MRFRILVSSLAVAAFWVGSTGTLLAGVPELVKQLQDASPEVRAKAAAELGTLGKEALPAVPDLVKLVLDPDATVRRRAISSLRQLKPGPKVVVPLLIKALEDADPAVAVAAVHSLAEIGEPVVKPMVQALPHKQAGYWACLVLADLGPKAKAAVPALIQVVGDTERPDVQREAVMTLGAIGPEAKDAVPALVKVLESGDSALAPAAAHSLGSIGPNASAAITALGAAQKGNNDFLKVLSTWALIKIQPENREVLAQQLPLILGGLSHTSSREVRMAAAQAVVDLRPDHAVLLPALAKVMDKADPEVIAHGIQAVAAVGKPAVPGMVRLLEHKKVRPLVVRVLAQIGSQATEAVPALLTCLKEEGSDPAACREILFALGQIGVPATDIPVISGYLTSEDEQVRYSATYALGKLGPAALEAVPALQKQIAGDDPFLRMISAWALVRIDPTGEKTADLTLELLTQALQHERPFVRIEGADALGRLGHRAAAALPKLEVMRHDADPAVRSVAETAIKKIKG